MQWYAVFCHAVLCRCHAVSREFQYYTNNRSNSYVRDGILYIKPTLTAEKMGEQGVYQGTIDMWGMSPGT